MSIIQEHSTLDWLKINNINTNLFAAKLAMKTLPDTEISVVCWDCPNRDIEDKMVKGGMRVQFLLKSISVISILCWRLYRPFLW